LKSTAEAWLSSQVCGMYGRVFCEINSLTVKEFQFMMPMLTWPIFDVNTQQQTLLMNSCMPTYIRLCVTIHAIKWFITMNYTYLLLGMQYAQITFEKMSFTSGFILTFLMCTYGWKGTEGGIFVWTYVPIDNIKITGCLHSYSPV
jgi:hypothetical protein